MMILEVFLDQITYVSHMFHIFYSYKIQSFTPVLSTRCYSIYSSCSQPLFDQTSPDLIIILILLTIKAHRRVRG